MQRSCTCAVVSSDYSHLAAVHLGLRCCAQVVHARIAMLAAVGWVVQERWHPLFGGGIEGPAVSHFQQVPPPFWQLLTAAVGVAEAARARRGWEEPSVARSWFKLRRSYAPGDLGFDPLGLFPLEPAAQRDMRTRELNNGRLGAKALGAKASLQAAFICGTDRH